MEEKTEPCCLIHSPWLNEISRLKIVPGISNQGAITWMIDSLYPRNQFHQTGIVVVYVFYEFRLGIRWTCDEHGTRIGYSQGNPMKEIMILRGVPAAH
jgi:hypothetical protein